MMTPKEYTEAVCRLEHETPDRFHHAVVGLSSEVGELAALMKRELVDDDYAPNRLSRIEELGDALYYIVLGLDDAGCSLDLAMQMNIAKLERRARCGKDKVAEQAMLAVMLAENERRGTR